MGSRDTRGRTIATAQATLIAVLTLIVTSDSGGPLSESEGRRPRARAISPAASGSTISTVPWSLPAAQSDTERRGREQTANRANVTIQARCVEFPSEKFGLAPESTEEALPIRIEIRTKMMIRIQRRRPLARKNRTVVTSAVTHDEIRGASLRRRRRTGWDGVVHPIPRRGIDMGNQPKNKMSRRNFLRNAAMGAATVGALAAAPSVLGLTENVGADTSVGDGGV